MESRIKVEITDKYKDIFEEFKDNKPIEVYCEHIITPMNEFNKIVMRYDNYKMSYMLNKHDIESTKLEIKEIIEYILNYMWDKMRKELHL